METIVLHQINHFIITQIFHLVCRIADTLHSLQNAGHTKYISWSLTFTCSAVSVEKLKDKAVSMEGELKELLDLVNNQRCKFHALNYFTTQQLLQIRREFGNLQQFKPNTITAELASLLMSFSLAITSDDVNNIVEEVVMTFSEQDAISKLEEQTNVETILSEPVAEDKEAVEAVESSPSENDIEQDTKPVDKEMYSKEELEELILNLSPDEEEVFGELRELKYSKIVSYKAVKHAFSLCTNGDEMLYVAMDWCFENANQCNEMDEANIGYDSSISVDNKGVVNELNNAENLHQENIPSEKPVQKEYIDIRHPVVQKLLELGFSPNLSIKGATLCNADYDLASEWCLNAEIEDDDEQQPLFGTATSAVPFLHYEETEIIARLACR